MTVRSNASKNITMWWAYCHHYYFPLFATSYENVMRRIRNVVVLWDFPELIIEKGFQSDPFCFPVLDSQCSLPLFDGLWMLPYPCRGPCSKVLAAIPLQRNLPYPCRGPCCHALVEDPAAILLQRMLPYPCKGSSHKTGKKEQGMKVRSTKGVP